VSVLRSMLVIMLLMMTVLAGGRAERLLPASAVAAEGPTPCNLGSLPSDIRNRLKSDFGPWKVQGTRKSK